MWRTLVTRVVRLIKPPLRNVQWRFRIQHGWRVLEFTWDRAWWAVWVPRHVALSLSRENARQLGTTLLHGGRGEGE